MKLTSLTNFHVQESEGGGVEEDFPHEVAADDSDWQRFKDAVCHYENAPTPNCSNP